MAGIGFLQDPITITVEDAKKQAPGFPSWRDQVKKPGTPLDRVQGGGPTAVVGAGPGQVLFSTGGKDKKPVYYSEKQALARPWAWTPRHKKKVLALVSQIVGEPLTDFNEEFFKKWKTAVDWAAKSNKFGNKKPITPYDALQIMAKQTKGGVTLDKNGNVTHTAKVKSVDEVTEGQAWGYLSSAVENAIGRAPTTAELHRFLAKAQDIAASNPSVTTTTTKTNADETRTSQTQKTEGGVKEGDLAMAAANMAATPEAAAYQVAGKYMNALTALLDGPVDLQANFNV